MPEDQTQILACTAEQCVDGIALGSFETIAMQQAVTFHVTGDRLDGVASFEFAPDTRRHVTPLPTVTSLTS